jgi:hypothetical protein
VGFALKTIKKKGHFKAYKESTEAYLEQHKLVKQAKAHQSMLDETTSKVTGLSKKPTKKPKETTAATSLADPAL